MSILALFLTLTIDPSPASLEQLQGTWHADNGIILVVEDRSITITTPDSLAEFTCRLQMVGKRLRFIDETGAREPSYRLDGDRFWLGTVEYRRRPLHQR